MSDWEDDCTPASGIVMLTSPSGYDDNNLEIFQNDEALNGPTSGNDFATVNGTGAVSISGRLIPDSDIIEYQGKFYCRPHFLFAHSKDWEDEARVDDDEGDRE